MVKNITIFYFVILKIQINLNYLLKKTYYNKFIRYILFGIECQSYLYLTSYRCMNLYYHICLYFLLLIKNFI